MASNDEGDRPEGVAPDREAPDNNERDTSADGANEAAEVTAAADATASERAEPSADLSASDASDEPASALPNDVPEPLAKRGWTRPVLNLVVLIGVSIALSSGMLVACNTKRSAVRNTNVGSRYGQVEGLVNHGTYAITNTRYARTIDKVRRLDGEYLSSKPPLLPTVTAGVYWVYRAVTGYDIRTDEQMVVRFCNWTMGAFLHTLLLLFWLRLLLLMTSRPEVVILGVGTVAFGFLGVGYAIELNNHTVAACITTVGFYYAYRIRHGADVRNYHYSLAGFLFGILTAVDVPSSITSIAAFIYLFTHNREKTLKYGLPFAIPGPVLFMLLNYLSHGSVLPVQLRAELKNYPGSYWANPKGIDALVEPKYIYGFNITVGNHGIFSMTPVLILGLIHVYRTFRRRYDEVASAHRTETIMLTVTTGILLAWHLFRTHNYGGNCVGLRWAIAWTPLFFILSAFYLINIKVKARHVAYICFGTGVTMFHVWECFWTPWHVSRWDSLVTGITKQLFGW